MENNGKKFIFSDDLSTITCSECGSTEIYVRSGMFCDTFICRKCGNTDRG